MKNTNTLAADARDLFISALEARISDRKARDVASVNKKGGGKYAAFIREVLELAKDMPVWNAYHTVVVRHENERSKLMQAHAWVRAAFDPESETRYDSLMSGFGAGNLLQQMMNAACWSERRALRNQSLDEGQVAELNYEDDEAMSVPESADQYHDANQRLQKLASILSKLQTNVYTSTDANYKLEPIVLFSADEASEFGGETRWVRTASADTFEDAMTLMAESIEQLRVEEQAAQAETAATFDYEAA